MLEIAFILFLVVSGGLLAVVGLAWSFFNAKKKA